MKTLGVIGGLGPMATAYFMQLVIDMTEAATDQQHIPMIIYNCPQIPDRTSFLLGKSEEKRGLSHRKQRACPILAMHYVGFGVGSYSVDLVRPGQFPKSYGKVNKGPRKLSKVIS